MHYLDRNTDYNTTEIAGLFDELSLWSSYFGQELLANVPMKRGMKVLDVGFGNGFPLFELAQRLGPTSEIHGVDLWEAAFVRAEHKKQLYGLKNVHLHLCDVAQMPFVSDSFDLIVSNLGINNFPNPQMALEACRRVAKADATIVLTSNTYGHFTEFYRVYEQILQELALSDCLDKLKAQENHRLGLEAIETLLNLSGWRLKRHFKKSYQWRYLDGTAMLNHSLTVFGFLEGWRNILPKEKEALVFDAIENRLNQIAGQEEGLSMSVPLLYIEAEVG